MYMNNVFFIAFNTVIKDIIQFLFLLSLPLDLDQLSFCFFFRFFWPRFPNPSMIKLFVGCPYGSSSSLKLRLIIVHFPHFWLANNLTFDFVLSLEFNVETKNLFENHFFKAEPTLFFY